MNKVQRKQFFIVFGIIFAILFLFVMAKIRDGVSLCLFKFVFHIPCPGCGISRGILAIFSGRFAEGLMYNVLSYPLAIGSVILIIWNVYDLYRGKQTFLDMFHRLKIGKMGFSLLFFIMLANWMYNIYRGF